MSCSRYECNFNPLLMLPLSAVDTGRWIQRCRISRSSFVRTDSVVARSQRRVPFCATMHAHFSNEVQPKREQYSGSVRRHFIILQSKSFAAFQERPQCICGIGPIARVKSMNSKTSNRRSPPSTLATNDWGRFRRLATSCWVRPALRRAANKSPHRAACSGECRDLVRPRAFLAIRRGNLIPDSDYPKKG